jgi:hypothetical protein
MVALKRVYSLLASSFELLARNPVAPLPPIYSPNKINPALLLFKEYVQAVNKGNKFHDSNAYQYTVKSINIDYDGKRNRSSLPDNYETLLQKKRINGIMFEFRLKKQKHVYGVKDDNGNYIPNKYLTDDQIKSRGLSPYEYTIAVFNPDKFKVGGAQDEWGAMLVYVAKEYKGFGLGPLLIKYARHFEPDKDSGGFTQAGINNLRKLHRELVRDALTNGLYRKWIDNGSITKDKVQQIIKESDLSIKPNHKAKDLDSTDHKDWMLYSDYEYGSFIIYNKKFKDLYNTGDDNHRWAESMIKGAINVYELDASHAVPCGIVNLFGGDTPKIKTFLMKLAATYCRDHKLPFYVDAVDIQYVSKDDFVIGELTNKTGIPRYPVEIKKPVKDLKYLGIPELKWRRSVDKYDELLNGILEMAHSKFRYDSTLEASDKSKGKAMTDKILEADAKPYTNKSKSVKVIYYSNRSTPQVAKPGQTVKAKAGYGKRTKIRSATAEEVAQFKQGKWLRTREDGKKHNDTGSKTSKYRPVLAKKQKDARKRRMAASDTPENRYKAFITEVFES